MWNYYAHMVPGQMTILRGRHNLHEKDCKEGKPKPLRGTVLELIQREQAAAEVSIQQLEAGGGRRCSFLGS